MKSKQGAHSKTNSKKDSGSSVVNRGLSIIPLQPLIHIYNHDDTNITCSKPVVIYNRQLTELIHLFNLSNL